MREWREEGRGALSILKMVKLRPREFPPQACSQPAGARTWSCTYCQHVPSSAHAAPGCALRGACASAFPLMPPPNLVRLPPPLAGRRRDCAAHRGLAQSFPGVPGAQSRRLGATQRGPYRQNGEWAPAPGLVDPSLNSVSVSTSLRVSLLSLSLSVSPIPFPSLPLS